MSGEWRMVPGFDGWYEVSNCGQLRSWRKPSGGSLDGPRLLKQCCEQGYMKSKLTHPVIGKVSINVSHIVAATFVGPRPHGKVCDHINGDRSDNRPGNLRWITSAENIKSAAAMGRMGGARSHSPLTVDDAVRIRELRSRGLTLAEISNRYPVTSSTISRICRNETWMGKKLSEESAAGAKA